MREILTVLGGLLIGILLTLGTIYLFFMLCFFALRQMMVKMHETEPKMRKLGEYVQRKQDQGIDLNEIQNDSEFMALTADIQASLNPVNFIPGTIRKFLPRKWKDAARLPQAIAYINEAVPKIVSDWNPLELVHRSTPKLRAANQPGHLEQNFAVFADRLGELQAYNGIKYFVQEQNTHPTRWNFVIEADFAKGAATITGQILWKGERLFFDSFYVSTFTADA
ncbi:MAG: hypothetical protein KME35_15190 [Aphanocapsa sp. GSE-SYN-MK-11-07L]|jgi:hypothetical protein|nr:hypothetical protein [Aphanocapsa sp. GSE-SYN-MK-11-07L]